jgi:hypothetical protein
VHTSAKSFSHFLPWFNNSKVSKYRKYRYLQTESHNRIPQLAVALFAKKHCHLCNSALISSHNCIFYLYVYVYLYVFVHMYKIFINIDTHTYMYTHTYIYIYLHIYKGWGAQLWTVSGKISKNRRGSV